MRDRTSEPPLLKYKLQGSNRIHQETGGMDRMVQEEECIETLRTKTSRAEQDAINNYFDI